MSQPKNITQRKSPCPSKSKPSKLRPPSKPVTVEINANRIEGERKSRLSSKVGPLSSPTVKFENEGNNSESPRKFSQLPRPGPLTPLVNSENNAYRTVNQTTSHNSSKFCTSTPSASFEEDTTSIIESRHSECQGQHHLHNKDCNAPTAAGAEVNTVTPTPTMSKTSTLEKGNSDSPCHKNRSPSPRSSQQRNPPTSSLPSKGQNPDCVGSPNPIDVYNNNIIISKDKSNSSVANNMQKRSLSIASCKKSEGLITPMVGSTNSSIFFKEKILRRVFSHLNHSDLLQCRSVQKLWNEIISQDENFLDTTVFVATIQKSYDVATDTVSYSDILERANLPFRHGCIQHIDYSYFKEPQYFVLRNSDNEKYFPSPTFLRSLSSLELKDSYLLWTNVKRILSKTPLLDKLVITNCCISDIECATHKLNEFDEFTSGNTIFGMTGLEIYEARCLENIAKILSKFTGYLNQSLKILKISYYPPASLKQTGDRKHAYFDFCRELKTIISECANTLEVLVLDLQYEPALNFVGYHLSKELEALNTTLDLKEFKLSPSLGVWLNKPEEAPTLHVAMTMKNVDDNAQKCLNGTAAALARFLMSQKHLKRLALPCIEYPEAFSSSFKSVLREIPCASCLQELAVPCAGFLPENFLHLFPNLKAIQVGTPCCGDNIPAWNVFQYYTREQNGTFVHQESNSRTLTIISDSCKTNCQVQQQSTTLANNEDESVLMKNITELYLHSPFQCPENFGRWLKCLCNLTSLEVNSGRDVPVLIDDDLQACIKHLKNLKNLVISCSDNLTDYGITGIPEEYCKLMFKHQKYHKDGVNLKIWTSKSVHGRPLSDLKRLRKLVLMGSSFFTDIGIGYGLTFKDLKYCHLPYSDNITSWGITRFGETNASIEVFKLSGVNQMTKDAFLHLRQTHDRVKKGDDSRSGYFEERESPLQDNLALILPTVPELLSSLVACLIKLVQPIVNTFETPEVQSNRILEEEAGDR